MCLPDTGALSWGVESPDIRLASRSRRSGPPQEAAPTPGSAYGRATPDLRPNPASSILIVGAPGDRRKTVCPFLC